MEYILRNCEKGAEQFLSFWYQIDGYMAAAATQG
jgi:hypothetical protein